MIMKIKNQLSKKQKIEFLNFCIRKFRYFIKYQKRKNKINDVFINRFRTEGFCSLFYDYCFLNNITSDYSVYVGDLFLELEKYKPWQTGVLDFWFECSFEGYKKRIDICKEILKELNK